MKKRLATAVVSAGLALGTMVPANAMTYVQRQHYIQHRRHMKTLKRVGVGAAGGAAIGAIAGGGKGAGIGALVGGGAGYLFDRHKKHEGKY
jgi:uncharacterized protein YcfJ